jgi:hypothetical protein
VFHPLAPRSLELPVRLRVRRLLPALRFLLELRFRRVRVPR